MATVGDDIEQQYGKRPAGISFEDAKTNNGDDHDISFSYYAHLKSQRELMSHSRHSTGASRERRTLQERNTIRVLGSLTGDVLDNFDDEDGPNLQGHHDVMLPFYAAPLQRQRWGEDQVLPHVNWGDLFFDLFYVGMAYNLGEMLKSAMNQDNWLRGIIYFFGFFGPLWISWERPMHYASRYTTVDYAHRLFEVIRYLFVSTAIMHISPVDKMSDPTTTETLIFTIAVFLESLMLLALHCEVYFFGQGDRESIKNHTLGHIKYHFIPNSLFYLAAMIVSIDLFVRSDESHRRLDTEDNYGNDSYATDSYANEDVAAPLWKMSDLPITLTAINFLVSFATTSLRKAKIAKAKDVRKFLVPSNTNYMIHRYGEWVLLMIGEGILSLLIVSTTESTNYYLVSTFGVLTMIFIQILKFENEPHHAEEHAMWRSLKNGVCYSFLIQVLSIGLIVFGMTYKVFLYDLVYENEYGGHKYEAAISHEAASAVFTISLVIVLLSLELMNITHTGLAKKLKNLVRTHKDGKHTAYWPVIFVSMGKMALLLFAATLNEWTERPEDLTIAGFVVVFCMTGARMLNYYLILKKEEFEKAEQSSSSVALDTFIGVNSVAQGGAGKNVSIVEDTNGFDTEKKAKTDEDHDFGYAFDDHPMDAIVVFGSSGVIKRANKRALSEFGYENRMDLEGQSISVLFQGGVDELFRESHSEQHIKKIIKRDGTQIPCVIATVKKNGDCILYIRNMQQFSANNLLPV